MVKTLKILFWNQKADDLGSSYAALGTLVRPSCSHDYPGLTMTFFMERSNLVSYAFVWEKVKQWILDAIVIYDIKVGRFTVN